MARFDLYHLSRGRGGYVVDVQSSHLDHLSSRVIVPLRRRTDAKPIADLHPEIDFGDATYVLMTHAVFAAPRRELGRAIGMLAAHRDAITRALDILLVGF
jgi:toxin CcdB